jgi:hypothetical protein
MSDAMVIVDAPAPLARTMLTRELLQAEEEQRSLLSQYVQRQMVEKVDYGKIPGTDKPTLLKPGAEKLVDLFRCTPKFKLIKAEEDFERGFFNYIFRVQLYQRSADAVLAEGYGSANSREGRYRWRDAQRKCPSCGKATIIKGRAEYGGGWLCFGKKGGCGAKFKEGDASVEKQEQGRVENDDIATLANTILKMAKKRALVDGAIALARCSDMFTQDVEDMADAPPAEDEKTPAPGQNSKPAQGSRPATNGSRSDALAERLKKEGKQDPPAAKSGEPSIWERMEIACREFGTNPKSLGPMLRSLFPDLPKTDGKKHLTEKHLAAVKAELAKALAAKELAEKTLNPPPADEPPPPSDEDVPF